MYNVPLCFTENLADGRKLVTLPETELSPKSQIAAGLDEILKVTERSPIPSPEFWKGIALIAAAHDALA